MTQVVSLYDILRRRRVAKKETSVAFIDYRKAFDTVPIESLLMKIYLSEVEGEHMNKVNENIALVSGNSVKIPALLISDDLVLLADSEVGLKENLLCGALAVGGSFEHPEISELQGQRVPIGKHKVEKAEACYTNIRRLLSSKSAPMSSRVLVLREVLEAKIEYGGEIKSMFRDGSRNLQRVLNNGLKNLIEVSERATIVKMGNLWLEFEVPPLYASFGYARVRKYQKFQDFSTPIALLLKDMSNGSSGKVSNGMLNRMDLKGKSKDDFLSTLNMNQEKFLQIFYIESTNF
ncbi:hypothetical protein AYI69_g315 [Smittium culicis]|uniref:Reverse transcriptase domain-containing protein n=1 Tax=Smittium culicis TaxID=133412 RepID=A0A1R1YTF0_9FUNG|nr:hypothetical protein AYI69_g315 [Smittium culicis]